MSAQLAVDLRHSLLPTLHLGGCRSTCLQRRQRPFTRRSGAHQCSAGKNEKGPPPVLPATSKAVISTGKEGPSADFSVIWGRLVKLGLPYWTAEDVGGSARWKLAGVVALTLGTTGVSVLFNFLGRDFFNALSNKDVDRFYQMLAKWLAALILGIPVFVMRDYFQSTLALDWRRWMTERITADYFSNRAFYQVQSGDLVDNPDQRIASDVRQFTDTALGFSTGLLNACVDLLSFSGILYTIYPPLFLALLVYSVGGTAVSLQLGKPLVGLNFRQEAREADFRYGLVRVRENTESVAFYGGEASEQRLLLQRLQLLVDNAFQLLKTERNLQFFTSFYRFLIGILPAAVVAPLYFQGKIEFGVVNQSSSAFNHILSDVSLVVFQFESLAGFSAIIDRLGEFTEVLEPFSTAVHAEEPASNGSQPAASAAAETADVIRIVDEAPTSASPLLALDAVTLRSPDGSTTLVQDLSLQVHQDDTLLIVGPSGAGKTSILRAIAGLWTSGSGTICRYGRPVTAGSRSGDIFFVPQRPYVVLGTLREQLLYPTWSASAEEATAADTSSSNSSSSNSNGASAGAAGKGSKPVPTDEEMAEVLRRVRLGLLLERGAGSGNARTTGRGLDHLADWGGILSLGEQQRLAFARVLLAKPRLVLMDESTSALDTDNEAHLFHCLQECGIQYVSIGHRPTLSEFHSKVLRLTLSPQASDGGAASADEPKCRWEIYPVGQEAEVQKQA